MTNLLYKKENEHYENHLYNILILFVNFLTVKFFIYLFIFDIYLL